MRPSPPRSTLFPYTTLFRSRQRDTIRSLGFSRLGGVVEREDSPTLRGMLLRSEEHTSELQSLTNLVCRLLLEKKIRCEAQRTSRRGKQPLRRSQYSSEHDHC